MLKANEDGLFRRKELKMSIKWKKIVSIMVSNLLIVMLISVYPVVIVAAEQGDDEAKKEVTTSDLDSIANMEEIHETAKVSYADYLESKDSSKRPQNKIIVEASDYIEANPEPKVYEDYEGMKGKSIYSNEEGFAKWEIDVPESGFYNIKVDYYPIAGKGMTIERELKINGEVPFDGAKYLPFSRIWKNKNPIEKDENDNEKRPSQVESPMWKTTYLIDYMGYEREPYLFYFEQGKNTIELESVQDMMLIRQFTLEQAEKIPTYEEKLKEYEANNYKEVELDQPIKIQGEHAELKSDAMLYPTFDRSTPATEPSHHSKIRLNTIGGDSWKSMGQWVTWKIDVPETGLYQFGIKFWQNVKSGSYTSRTLKIDGEIPFEEMKNLRFVYDMSWQSELLEGKDPYLFYLEEGEHEISLEVSLGDLADVINMVEESLYELNYAYRQMLMIIGSSPDAFRDYQLELKVPNAIEILNDERVKLEEASKIIEEATGRKGASTTALDTLTLQLKKMYDDPDTIPERWDAFNMNLSSLGAWVLDMQEQPLQIDYLYLTSDHLPVPSSKANLVSNASFAVKSFFASFIEDYSSVGTQDQDALTVWVGSRDYGLILNSLIENYLEPIADFKVNVEIVDAGTLLPATLAGVGPDVALEVGIGDPVNYAVRNAIVDLSQFPDFEEVTSRFAPSAMIPFEFESGYYALPETQTFPMMFYRKDIFEELQISPPETWDDLYEIMPHIQKSNMNIGIPINGVSGTGSVSGTASTLSSYTMFLYQNEGQLYEDGGISTALEEEAAIKAFADWTSLYVNYSIPVLYDFANRFRTGEMPIGIADYSTFNYLSVFAPELKGLWEMVPVPGTVKDDQSINRAVSSSGVASIIMKSSDKQEEAWEFIKWWTSADIQAKFGTELESIIGVAARYATANLEAVELLGWSSRVHRNLMEQWEWVEGNPEVPGGYFTPRHIENAFRKVFNDLDDPRETILDYSVTIDLEISNKRKEFGLETKE